MGILIAATKAISADYFLPSCLAFLAALFSLMLLWTGAFFVSFFVSLDFAIVELHEKRTKTILTTKLNYWQDLPELA